MMINKKNIFYSFTRIPKINYSTLIRNEDLKQFSEIPGPKVYPFVGNLFELKSFGLFYWRCCYWLILFLYSIRKGGDLEMSNLTEFFNKLNNKYGDLVKWNLFNRTQVNKNSWILFHVPFRINESFLLVGFYI